MKKSSFCKHCEKDISQYLAPAFSMKFNSYFCDQKCYENFRKKLDENWNDKRVIINE